MFRSAEAVLLVDGDRSVLVFVAVVSVAGGSRIGRLSAFKFGFIADLLMGDGLTRGMDEGVVGTVLGGVCTNNVGESEREMVGADWLEG